MSLISTCHVEKQNHTLRMHCRRLSRLTNAFSKKIENFEAAIALHFAYYNFIKTHGALKMTIGHLHNCGATWRESGPVHEVFRGETVWKGDVEVFDLIGHPKAKRAYGWSHSGAQMTRASDLWPFLRFQVLNRLKRLSGLQSLPMARKRGNNDSCA